MVTDFFSDPFIYLAAPFIGAMAAKSKPGVTRLDGFSRGLGAAGLGLLGVAGGTLADSILKTRKPYMAAIGGVLGGAAGLGLGGELIKLHDASQENENAIREYIAAAKKEEKLNKQAAAIGGLVGAIVPELSAVGGATRGAFTAGGGTLGGLLGYALGDAFGGHIGNWFYDSPYAGALLGKTLGVPLGAVLGGRLGWEASKKMLQEHAFSRLIDRERGKKKKEE